MVCAIAETYQDWHEPGQWQALGLRHEMIFAFKMMNFVFIMMNGSQSAHLPPTLWRRKVTCKRGWPDLEWCDWAYI